MPRFFQLSSGQLQSGRNHSLNSSSTHKSPFVNSNSTRTTPNDGDNKRSNPYQLELNMSPTLDLDLKVPMPEQLQLKNVHMDLSLSPLGSNNDRNAEQSAFYARVRSKEQDDRQIQKPSFQPITVPSLAHHSTPASASQHLKLDLGSQDSFSSELEAILFKPDVSSDLPSKSNSTKSKLPYNNNNNHSTSLQTQQTQQTQTQQTHAQVPKFETDTASFTPNTYATLKDPYTADYHAQSSPSSSSTTTINNTLLSPLKLDDHITAANSTTLATYLNTTDSKGSTLSSPSFVSLINSRPLPNDPPTSTSNNNNNNNNNNNTTATTTSTTTTTTTTASTASTASTHTNNIHNLNNSTTTLATSSNNIMTYPSPTIESTPMEKTIHGSDIISSIETSTTTISDPSPSPSPSLHSTSLAQPIVSYTTITDSDDEQNDSAIPLSTSQSDRDPSSPYVSPSSLSSIPNENAQSQDHYTQNNSLAPLQIKSEIDYLKPIPQKSEDWAALIDTPASPTRAQYPTMPKPLFSAYGAEGYTESPAPEDNSMYGHSSDYMQHMTYHNNYHNQQYYQQQQQQQYYSHQHYGSTSSVPLPSQHRAVGSVDSTNGSEFNPYRKSWSASETMNGHGYSSYGYLTPPRHPDDNNRSRPGSSLGVRQSPTPTPTSFSLLSDAALLAKYRETAIKTNDPTVQLSYAKYLLEIGEAPAANGSTSSSNSDIGTPRPSFVTTNNSPPSSIPSSPTTSQDPDLGKRQLTQEAIYWIDRLAKEGQAEAQYIRGSWYEDGLYSCKQNFDKALRWYQSSSKGDYSPAHYKVAYYCEKKKDNNKAVMLYKKAAVHNEAPANHRLAMIYLYGELGQSRNMKAGLEYLKRAASFATESAPKSPYVLGLILARQYGDQLRIPDDIAFPDDGEALEWFRKSAHLGYGPANYKLGYCYEYGSLGCMVDPYLSVHHYERAVLAGDSNGEAEMALSGWYLSGAENCFQADDQLAFKYASMAAAKQFPKAQYAMGYYYETGISVPADMEKAMEYYKLAADNGNKDAIKRLEDKSEDVGKMGHKKSIKRINQGRKSKDQSCTIM